MLLRGGKNHAQAQQKEDDSPGNLDGVVIYMQKMHQPISHKIEEDDDEKSDDQFSANNDALPLRFNAF